MSIQVELRNNLSKTWTVKMFDLFPFARIISSSDQTEVEIGWLNFSIVFIS